VFELCGLADISLIPKIAIGIVAEARFKGIEIEAAAKYIAEISVELQKQGVTLNGSYWRDLKWRSYGKGQQTSASEQRSERINQALVNAFSADAWLPDETDGGEREDKT
jgi:hypothetical protein